MLLWYHRFLGNFLADLLRKCSSRQRTELTPGHPSDGLNCKGRGWLSAPQTVLGSTTHSSRLLTHTALLFFISCHSWETSFSSALVFTKACCTDFQVLRSYLRCSLLHSSPLHSGTKTWNFSDLGGAGVICRGWFCRVRHDFDSGAWSI